MFALCCKKKEKIVKIQDFDKYIIWYHVDTWVDVKKPIAIKFLQAEATIEEARHAAKVCNKHAGNDRNKVFYKKGETLLYTKEKYMTTSIQEFMNILLNLKDKQG